VDVANGEGGGGASENNIRPPILRLANVPLASLSEEIGASAAYLSSPRFWESCAPEEIVFADKTNLLGIEGATVSCCRIKNHAARTGQ
jgi:hypothetical protein